MANIPKRRKRPTGNRVSDRRADAGYVRGRNPRPPRPEIDEARATLLGIPIRPPSKGKRTLRNNPSVKPIDEKIRISRILGRKRK